MLSTCRPFHAHPCIQVVPAACPAPAAAAQKISASVQRTPPPPMCSSVSMLAWCSAATCRLQRGPGDPCWGSMRDACACLKPSWKQSIGRCGTSTGHETESSGAGSAAGPCAKLCQAAQGAAGMQVVTAARKNNPCLPQNLLLVVGEGVVRTGGHGQHRQAPPVFQLQHVATQRRHLCKTAA